MVLEATVIVIDNSEWMRNGDYTPSRVDAQKDAVNLIFGAKTQSNPENTVGLMTMAGKSPEVLVTLTADIGKILSAMHSVKLNGKPNLPTGIQIAQLALKHRQNKNQRQRVIVFVGSPIDVDEKTLVKIGKKLKKNNVAVDIVNFGEEAENTAKLEAFVNAVNSGDNSHLVTVPPGPHILSDLLISSPIIAGEDGVPAGLGGGAGFEFGVDPSLDPELALALRISLEEERARQEAESGKTGGPAPGGDAMAVDAPAAGSSSGAGATDEEEMLAKALAMSMSTGGDGDVQMGESTEDDEIARAIALSMQDQGTQGSSNIDAGAMANILGSLPGVNPDDPRLQNLGGQGSKGKDDKGKGNGDKKDKK
ncbi:hypothetical protein BKA69DRAFT_1110332 [Paraphysoderma sedebokerense]|nr:hypothetical protein BKA69DRAFT_1110332 [Paraphysoderma sedebokerense]